MVALLHDGVEWWPEGRGIGTRADRLAATVRGWASEVDIILGGHNFGAWSGDLAGTPFAEPNLWAASVAVVDLDDAPLIQGIRRVAPVEPARSSPAIEAVRAADARVVGELSEQWLTRTGADAEMRLALDEAGDQMPFGGGKPMFHLQIVHSGPAENRVQRSIRSVRGH